MDNNTGIVIILLGFFALIAFSIWYTNDYFPLLALFLLLFFGGTSTSNIDTKCPKCHHKFTVKVEDDEDDN